MPHRRCKSRPSSVGFAFELHGRLWNGDHWCMATSEMALFSVIGDMPSLSRGAILDLVALDVLYLLPPVCCECFLALNC